MMAVIWLQVTKAEPAWVWHPLFLQLRGLGGLKHHKKLQAGLSQDKEEISNEPWKDMLSGACNLRSHGKKLCKLLQWLLEYIPKFGSLCPSWKKRSKALNNKTFVFK